MNASRWASPAPWWPSDSIGRGEGRHERLDEPDADEDHADEADPRERRRPRDGRGPPYQSPVVPASNRHRLPP